VVRLKITDIDLWNSAGQAAIHFAFSSRNALILRTLLESPRVDQNVKDDAGRNALILTCGLKLIDKSVLEIVEILV